MESSARSAEAIGKGWASLGESLGAGIAKYYEKKDEEEQSSIVQGFHERVAGLSETATGGEEVDHLNALGSYVGENPGANMETLKTLHAIASAGAKDQASREERDAKDAQARRDAKKEAGAAARMAYSLLGTPPDSGRVEDYPKVLDGTYTSEQAAAIAASDSTDAIQGILDAREKKPEPTALERNLQSYNKWEKTVGKNATQADRERMQNFFGIKTDSELKAEAKELEKTELQIADLKNSKAQLDAFEGGKAVTVKDEQGNSLGHVFVQTSPGGGGVVVRAELPGAGEAMTSQHRRLWLESVGKLVEEHNKELEGGVDTVTGWARSDPKRDGPEWYKNQPLAWKRMMDVRAKLIMEAQRALGMEVTPFKSLETGDPFSLPQGGGNNNNENRLNNAVPLGGRRNP
tara:strand:+ start:1525 stop:2739 length:1215 start_codon:yes stop_codon:yes gene_type:complete